MTESLQIFSIKDVARGWEFVNMYRNRDGLYHCRIRKIDPRRSVNSWDEISASGATMQIAFDRANQEAAG